jgi:phosphoribosylformylglycinamidine synthase subunit PurL
LIVLLDADRPAHASKSDAGALRREFSSSEYASTIHGIVAGAPPAIDLAAEKRLIECLVKLAGEKALVSAHDVSDGGLAVTLAECCFGSSGLSANVNLVPSSPASTEESRAETWLFGERGARAVVSVSPAALARVESIAAQYGVKSVQLGTVTRGEFRIQCKGVPVIAGEMDSLRQTWGESLGKALDNA